MIFLVYSWRIVVTKNIEKTRTEIDKLLAELNTQTPEVAQALNKSLKDLSLSLDQINKTAIPSHYFYQKNTVMRIGRITNFINSFHSCIQCRTVEGIL